MCSAKNEKNCIQISDKNLRNRGRLDDQSLDGEKL